MTKQTPQLAADVAEPKRRPILSGSSLSVIHRSGSRALRTALETLPTWVAVRDQLLALEAMRPAYVNRASLDEELTAYVRGLIDRGEVLDVDAAAQHFRDLRATVEALLDVDRAAVLAIEMLSQELDEALRGGQAQVYASLSAELATVVDEARAVSDVAGLDPTTVLTRGLGDTWQRYDDLRVRFIDIRSAQTSMQQQLSFPDVLYPELTRLANPADVFEHWRAWKVDGALVNPHDLNDRRPVAPPWPTEPTGTPARDHDAWFSWLVRTPAAKAWVPSAKQFDVEQTRLREYVSDLIPYQSRFKVEPQPPDDTTEYAERPAEAQPAGRARKIRQLG